MNELKLITKTFKGAIVRLTNDETENENQILFVAKDVCETLGYKRPRDAVTQHCKGAVKHRVLTSGGDQNVTFIPESDVYRLVMRSNLENAQQFQDWVCEDVLPSLRQTGSYETEKRTPIESTGDPILDMLKLMATQRAEFLGITEKTKEIDNRLEAIEAGTIPTGWNTVAELARMAGISKNKALEIIAAFSVAKKRIPQSGAQRISYATVADEDGFFTAFEQVKSESEKCANGFYKHEKLGRFSVKERE